MIASGDARAGSLHLHQDARLHSAILDDGQHVVHALFAGRGAWLHVVTGAVTVEQEHLRAGDGAAIFLERSVSLTTRGRSEILLVDLAVTDYIIGHDLRSSPLI